MIKKIRASKEKNQAFYWFRRNVIQSDEELNTIGRMVMQMVLLQPYKATVQTQAKWFHVSLDMAWKVRRLAVKPFMFKGVEAALFEKKGNEYIKTKIADWNERFNACPYLDTYFRTITLRVDLAFVPTDGKAHGSARELAAMMVANTSTVRDALRDNRAKDETIFEIEAYKGGRHSYRPRLERVSHLYEKKVKKLDKKRPDKQVGRYILETQFNIKGRKALAFIKDYIVPAQGLKLTGSFEKLVKAVATFYQDLLAMRIAAGNPERGFGPGYIITMYLEWIVEQRHDLPPSTKVLSIRAKWFGQFRHYLSGLEQHDIITGEHVSYSEVVR